MSDETAILMVDDVEANLVALEALFSDLGCHLVRARSGNEALSQLLKREFAVIVLDVQMPDMDGYEVARYVRQNVDTRDVPIIFVTAIDRTQEGVRRAYEDGAVDFLFKPVDPDVLRSKVRVFVELYQTRQRLLRVQSQVMELETAQRIAEAQRRLLVELEVKNAELSRVNAELELFAHAAAHDLKTPVRGVLNLVQCLDEDAFDTLDARRKGYLKSLRERAQRLDGMVDGLLDFARAPVLEGTTQPVDLRQLLLEVSSGLPKHQAERVVVPECLPQVQLASSALKRVFSILVENAFRHNVEGSVSVRISASQSEHLYSFGVHDDGVGIPPAYRERIFQMFQTLHPKEESSANGIGLALAKKIVDSGGGRLWLELGRDGGASFCFTAKRGVKAPLSVSTERAPEAGGAPAPGAPSASHE
jgi:signal transduction histidine kinase